MPRTASTCRSRLPSADSRWNLWQNWILAPRIAYLSANKQRYLVWMLSAGGFNSFGLSLGLLPRTSMRSQFRLSALNSPRLFISPRIRHSAETSSDDPAGSTDSASASSITTGRFSWARINPEIWGWPGRKALDTLSSNAGSRKACSAGIQRDGDAQTLRGMPGARQLPREAIVRYNEVPPRESSERSFVATTQRNGSEHSSTDRQREVEGCPR
jgi:hypothetical protein